MKYVEKTIQSQEKYYVSCDVLHVIELGDHI